MAEIFRQEFDFDNPKSIFFHGDCVEGMKAFPDGYFDLILTDPPYGTTQISWDIQIDLDAWWVQINRVAKINERRLRRDFNNKFVFNSVKRFEE